MSVYLSVLFGALTLEMACLFVLVLPLHYKIRKGLVSTYDRFMSYTQVKTVIWITSGLVALLFVDSWKRAQVSVFLHHYQGQGIGGASADPTGAGAITPVQALASRAYNQRNTYISGFILYFCFCIPTVISVVRRLVKYETLLRDKDSQSEGQSEAETEAEAEVAKLKKELSERKASIKALEKQKANLEAHFDSSAEAQKNTDPKLKKDN
ncbi:LAQU0S01e08086g1_1 [Lachancea quebecensis]|uniref:Endoplasmic reticulum transmembrane protein n=1 Tax=Lachancea quebecensis TaxID=1654605 RepID=A0A0P1KMY4_9SACH|nr:LAQU0S01e08086g1_1 [Lachancea quebecensis]